MRINCLFICPDSVSRVDMVLQSCYARCGYGFGSHITQKTGIILSTVGILGAFGGDILVDVLAMTDPTYMKQIFYFTQNDYGFFQLLLGIGLFIIFLKAKITYPCSGPHFHSWHGGRLYAVSFHRKTYYETHYLVY